MPEATNEKTFIQKTGKEESTWGKPSPRWEDNIKVDLRPRMYGCGIYPSISGYGPVAGSYKYSHLPSRVK
jgi:hypothetical protein